MKWGTGKLKGKLRFKCGTIGHFSSKCPYLKGLESNEEEETPKIQKKYQKKHKRKCLKRKNLYSKEDSSSFDEDDSDSDWGKVLFMEFEEQIENNEDDSEEEG